MLVCCCTGNTQNDTSQDDDAEDADRGVSAGQYLALLVVGPLFLLCYGGSCVAYIVYKVYRRCSRRSLHAQFVKLHAADYASQMMPPSYPIIPESFLAKKKEPCQPSVYLSEPVAGATATAAAAAVSFFCLHMH